MKKLSVIQPVLQFIPGSFHPEPDRQGSIKHLQADCQGCTCQNSRMPSYDLVRLSATIMIILFHLNTELVISGCQSPLIVVSFGCNMNIGQAGTSLFFILSGVLQSRSWEKTNGECCSRFLGRLFSYYKNRWLSIFPLYYTAYVFGHMVSTLHSDAAGISHQLIWTVLGIDGYVRLLGVPCSYIVGEWFLGAILALYLLLPFMYTAINRRPVITAIALTILFLLSVIFLSDLMMPDINILNRSVEYAFGIYFWLFIRKVPRGIRLFAGGVSVLSIMFIKISLPVMFLIVFMGTGLFLLIQGLGEFIKTERKVLIGILSASAALSYPMLLIHHILIQMSLEKRQYLEMGYKGYLVWCGYVMIVILIASILVNSFVKSMKRIHGGWLSGR